MDTDDSDANCDKRFNKNFTGIRLSFLCIRAYLCGGIVRDRCVFLRI